MSDGIPVFKVENHHTYGKLPGGFNLALPETGYFSISGLNNAGKSTVLQWLFSSISTSIFIPAERGVVRPTIDSGILALKQYLDTFRAQVKDEPLDIVKLGRGNIAFGNSVRFAEMDSYCECLLSSMVRDKGVTDSITELAAYVKEFGLGNKVKDKNDQLLIDDRLITQMGTGARSLLMVIMALIHPDYTTVLIDEPELFLEPRAQKALRDLLLKKGETKRIVVATHSHLMLNKSEDQFKNNFYFDERFDETRKLSMTSSKSDLRNLTFKLLGASFDDLMLSENYLIVEGDSDRIFMSKVLSLIDSKKAEKVQVAYAQGIQNIPKSVGAIAEMIRPYYAEDSIYKERIVCLVDEPVNKSEEKSVSELESHLNTGAQKRCFRLGVHNNEKLDLEKAIPDVIYTRCGLVKNDVLTEIKRLKDAKDHSALGKYKSNMAINLCSQLEQKDLALNEMGVICAAGKQALSPIE